MNKKKENCSLRECFVMYGWALIIAGSFGYFVAYVPMGLQLQECVSVDRFNENIRFYVGVIEKARMEVYCEGEAEIEDCSLISSQQPASQEEEISKSKSCFESKMDDMDWVNRFLNDKVLNKYQVDKHIWIEISKIAIDDCKSEEQPAEEGECNNVELHAVGDNIVVKCEGVGPVSGKLVVSCDNWQPALQRECVERLCLYSWKEGGFNQYYWIKNSVGLECSEYQVMNLYEDICLCWSDGEGCE